MDLANQGAVNAIKMLTEADVAQIGAVDTEVKWMGEAARMLPMNASNKRLLRENTLSNHAGGGGIYCKTALDHAYRLITAPGVTAMTRHVILFADCDDSEQQEDCWSMAEKYRHANPPVTTTVIGLGTPADSDVAFQRELAKRGGGRSYITNDAMALPRIFTGETFLVSRKAYVEKPEGLTPALYDSPLLEGITRGGMPRIYGYVGTTLKPRATLAAHGLEVNDPVLAHWTIGLGKCVAYTSDATGRWGKDLVRWEGFPKLWSQTVRWAARSAASGEILTSATIDGTSAQAGRVLVQATRADGRPINNLDLTASVAPPDGSATALPQRISLNQTGPGQYEGNFTAPRRGTYTVGVVDEATHTLVDHVGAVLSYPAEFRVFTPNQPLMETLAEITGGKIVTNLDECLVPKEQPVPTTWPLWDRLVLLAAAGLIVDVAWRRLKFEDWFKTLPQRGPALAGAGGTALEALQMVHQIGGSRKSAAMGAETSAAPAAQPASTTRRPAAADASAAAARSDAAPPLPPSPTAAEGGLASRLFSAKQRAADEVRKRQDK
jgi:hypothetical protein